MSDEVPTAARRDEHEASVDELLARLLGVDERAGSRVAVIAEWVARGIIRGDLAPGDDLNSVELAHRFDTSRTPAREALLLLQVDGLVEIPARRRPRVATLDPTRIEEIYRLRAHLQALTARRAAELADQATLEALGRDVERMGEAVDREDLDAFFWANVAFHERETEAAEDVTLKRALDSLGVRVLVLRRHTMSLPSRMQASLEDHRRLLRAYAERDVELAAVLAPAIIHGAHRAMVGHGGPPGSAR